MVEREKNASDLGEGGCGSPVRLDRGTLLARMGEAARSGVVDRELLVGISAELYFRYHLLAKEELEKSDMLYNTILKAFEMTGAARMRGGSYSLTKDEVKKTVKSIDKQFASKWADKAVSLKFGSAAWTWSYLEFSARAEALKDFAAMLRPAGITFGKGELESGTLVAELRKENIVRE